MSAQYLNSDTPTREQNIKCNDIIVRGGMSAANYIDVKTLNVEDLVLTGVGQITMPALVNYTQLTSETTPVTITGAEQQFKITTAVASNFNPGTTRLFFVNHSKIFTDTMVLVSRAGSVGNNQQLLTWVAYTTPGVIRVGLHNLSTVVATGSESLIFKLIQTA